MGKGPEVVDLAVLHLETGDCLDRSRLVDVEDPEESEFVLWHPDVFIGDLDEARADVAHYVVLY
jgi:hypothetical protein